MIDGTGVPSLRSKLEETAHACHRYRSMHTSFGRLHGHWQGENDDRAAALPPLDMDRAAVELDDVFHDAEAEAGAAAFAGAAFIDAVEALENMGEIFFGDTRPVVDDRADDVSGSLIELDVEH